MFLESTFQVGKNTTSPLNNAMIVLEPVTTIVLYNAVNIIRAVVVHYLLE